MQTETVDRERTLERRVLVGRGVLALGLSLALNWAILAGVRATDFVDPFDALTVAPVTVLTVAGVIGATGLYGILPRFTNRPAWAFTRIAVVVLVLSFVPDVALLYFDPAATVPAVLVLMGMHVTVAGSCILALTGRLSRD